MKKRYVLLIIICVLFVSYPSESAGVTVSREDAININEESRRPIRDPIKISKSQTIQFPTKTDIEIIKKDIGLIIQDFKFEERSRFWVAIAVFGSALAFIAKIIYYDINKTNIDILGRIITLETIYRIKQPSNSV